jgi:hypothetical protein
MTANAAIAMKHAAFSFFLHAGSSENEKYQDVFVIKLY